MIDRSSSFVPIAASAGAIAGLYALSALLLRSSMFTVSPDVIAAGVTLDLTVTATFAVYVLAVRRGHLPRAALIGVFFCGLLVAHALVPEANRSVASGMAVAWGLVELAVVVWLVSKARAVVRDYRAARADGTRGVAALESALEPTLGQHTVARLFAQELAIIYYATVGLLRRAPQGGLRDRDESTWGAVLVGLLMLLVGEAVAAHILLRSWSMTVAVVVGVLHVYSLLWLVGDYRALRLTRGIRIEEDELVIELGLRARGRVECALIESVEVVGELDDDLGRNYTRAHILGAPNLLVTLREPVPMRLFLGRERAARTIGLAVDDPAAVAAELKACAVSTQSMTASSGLGKRSPSGPGRVS